MRHCEFEYIYLDDNFTASGVHMILFYPKWRGSSRLTRLIHFGGSTSNMVQAAMEREVAVQAIMAGSARPMTVAYRRFVHALAHISERLRQNWRR